MVTMGTVPIKVVHNHNSNIAQFPVLIEEMHKRQLQEGPSIQLLKESLINTRQHEAFLRIILVRQLTVKLLDFKVTHG